MKKRKNIARVMTGVLSFGVLVQAANASTIDWSDVQQKESQVWESQESAAIVEAQVDMETEASESTLVDAKENVETQPSTEDVEHPEEKPDEESKEDDAEEDTKEEMPETTPDSGWAEGDTSTPSLPETEVPEQGSGDLDGEVPETVPETVPDSGLTDENAPTPDAPETESPEQGSEGENGEPEQPEIADSPESQPQPPQTETVEQPAQMEEIQEEIYKENEESYAPIFWPSTQGQGTITNLSVSKTQIKELVSMLDAKASKERVQVVLHAYSLVGKVPYFWGGKSTVLGWDANWGRAALVTSAGSSTSGIIQPYGLDCSGFVSWAFSNAAGNKEVGAYLGEGTSSQWHSTDAISEEQALPGDLAFMNGPESGGDNHVGIVVGHNKEGQLLYVHCNASDNNVSVTTADKGGFRYLRRPKIYTDEKIGFVEMVENQIHNQEGKESELLASFYDLQIMMDKAKGNNSLDTVMVERGE